MQHTVCDGKLILHIILQHGGGRIMLGDAFFSSKGELLGWIDGWSQTLDPGSQPVRGSKTFVTRAEVYPPI